ncbi:MAG: glycosyl transferase [Candidatus Thermofonsia Clade 1 bacterium]|jgi:glycosyltransferase involved in cell wall biosynthesis|uniref:dolichyl-phosphate beta-glucosyltransferase n=1 Tax=Candidatus Thermofonsia Clade 1 bacterium TaxID=2364210 RepID=A0A2M8PGD4_9CHLR|nr:MAG: glycosyl transferase [Candidatus Thermofonsia Clade 1 bacterium]RMF50541.1 MAG: glycosyltransferase family 2 protein [Chloroflexota bacterium]
MPSVSDQLSQLSAAADRPFLSIVIPALNEAQRLPESLAKIDAFLKQQPYSAEVIVVENGSTDDTVGVVQAFMRHHPYVRLFAGEPRGKGRAVRRGMLEARGAYRFLCDADLSMPIQEIKHFLPPVLEGYDVIIGSREAKGARRYNEPWHRHFMGRINNWIIKLFAVRGFEDTQCGFKAFTARAAEDLFGVSVINGIGFDVEILFIAQKRGYRIAEVPINWYFDPDSRMRLIKDSLGILREIFAIRRNWNKGLYAKRA